MFKKLVPVVALALLAGPVFAADAPATTNAPAAEQPAKASKSHKKHHKKAKADQSKDQSNAPAK